MKVFLACFPILGILGLSLGQNASESFSTTDNSNPSHRPCKLIYLNKRKNETENGDDEELNVKHKGRVFIYREKSIAVMCDKSLKSLSLNLKCDDSGSSPFKKLQCFNFESQMPCKENESRECKIMNKIRNSVKSFSSNSISPREKETKDVLIMLPCKEFDPVLTRKWLKHIKSLAAQPSNSTFSVKYFTVLSCRAKDYFRNNLGLFSKFHSAIEFKRINDGSYSGFPVNKTVRYCDRSSMNLEKLRSLYETVINYQEFTIFNSFSIHTIRAMNLLSKLALEGFIRFKIRRRRLKNKDERFGSGVLYIGGTRTCLDDEESNLTGATIMSDQNFDEDIFVSRSCNPCWRFRFIPFPLRTTPSTVMTTTTTYTAIPFVVEKDYTPQTTTQISRVFSYTTSIRSEKVTTTVSRELNLCKNLPIKRSETFTLWELFALVLSLAGVSLLIFTTITYLILVKKKRESPENMDEDEEIKIHEVFLPFGLLILYSSNFFLIVIRNPIVNCSLRRLLPGIGAAVVLTGVLTHVLQDMKRNAYTVNTFESRISHGGLIFIIGTCLIACQTLGQVLWIRLSPKSSCGGICDYNVHRQFIVSFSYPIFIALIITLLCLISLKRKVRIGSTWNMTALLGSLFGALVSGLSSTIVRSTELHDTNAFVILSQTLIAFSTLTCVFLRKYLGKSRKLWPGINASLHQIQHIRTRQNPSRANTITHKDTKEFMIYSAGTMRSERSFSTVRSGASFILPSIIAMPESNAWSEICRWNYEHQENRELEDLCEEEEEEEVSTTNSELSTGIRIINSRNMEVQQHFQENAVEEYPTENIYSEAEDFR